MLFSVSFSFVRDLDDDEWVDFGGTPYFPHFRNGESLAENFGQSIEDE